MAFEISEKDREDFIAKHIVGKFSGASTERVRQIAINYEGRDMDALNVLAYAVEKGKFEEYAGRLEKYFREDLQFIYHEGRRLVKVPGAMRAEKFFMDCFEELGVKPHSEEK